MRLHSFLFVVFFVQSSAYKLSSRYKRSSPISVSARDKEEWQGVLASYDGKKIDKYYAKRPLQVWERLVDIGSPLVGWWISRQVDELTSSFRTKEENQERLNLRAADFKDSIVQGKSVTFIKSGQALSLRPDLVKSAEYVRELQKLQDEVGTFSNVVALKIIKDELGCDANDIYEFEEELPIASASIGQVYKARLRSTNQSVAVKVQRPDAIDLAPLDMYILRTLAAALKKGKNLRSDMVAIADEFGYQLYNELNYNQEARNCEKFKLYYGAIPGIKVPAVYVDYTSRRVLTMEFIEGTKGPWDEGGERMLTVGLQCSVLQLLGAGYFHSDPHRGNLLQTRDGKLGYLDFGMMAEVPAEKRFALIGTVLGLVNKDIAMVVTNMKELQFFPPETDSDLVVSALSNALANSTKDGQGSSLNFTKLNANLEGISTLLPFRLPPFYTLIIRSLTILEGLAVSVDPSFQLVRGAYPFVARQILADPSTEMSQLLNSILVDKLTGRIQWDKLEQFISISSSANAAMEGDFEALKTAQSRSDVLKNLQEEGPASDFNFEVTSQMMDYLLSDNGKFLREPLVYEIVETIDSLGLTAASIASLLTSGLPPPLSIPQPRERADKERVLQFLNILDTLTAQEGQVKVKVKSAEVIDSDIDFDQILRLLGNLSSILKAMLSTVSTDTMPTSRQKQLQPILSRSSEILREVLQQLLLKNAKRSVKTVISKSSVKQALPLLARALDFM